MKDGLPENFRNSRRAVDETRAGGTGILPVLHKLEACATLG